MTSKELAEKYAKEEKYIPRWDMEQSDIDEIVIESHLAGQKAALDIKDRSDKRLEPILRKLKDLGVIASWYKNDAYHAC